MEPDSKEFLLKEYEELWGFYRELYNTRSKAIAFYLIIFGAVVGTVASQLNSKPTTVSALEQLYGVSALFVVPAGLFLCLASAALLFHLSRWRTLMVEYCDALNGIRAAFRDVDTWIETYLVLPIDPLRMGGRSLDRDLYTVVNIVGAAVVAPLTIYAVHTAECGFARSTEYGAGALSAGVWFLLWVWYWRHQIIFEELKIAPRLRFDRRQQQ